MTRANTVLLILIVWASTIYGQSGSQQKPPELPINISWDESGVLIRTQREEVNTSEFLRIQPSEHLEKVGNDLIRVSINDNEIPVIIDLTQFFSPMVLEEDADEETTAAPFIEVYKPNLSIGFFDEPSQYTLTLKQFAKSSRKAEQTFLFKGLDVFLVEGDKAADISANDNSIDMDLSKSVFNYLVLRGATLEITGLEEKLPELCTKYNEKFRAPEAFVSNSDSKWDLEYVRDLVTNYNITDFDDEPIAYLEKAIFTQKGIGLNLLKLVPAKKGILKSPEGGMMLAEQKFFYWPSFVNLSFIKHRGDKEIIIRDPYGTRYIFQIQENFSNVELIQFFKELQYTISKELK